MKKKYNLMLAFALVGAIALTGCNNESKKDDKEATSSVESVESAETTETAASTENADKEAEADDAKLADWAGEWNSIATYLDKDELKDSYKKVAERDKISEEEAKTNFSDKVKVDFGAVKIDDKTITFLQEPGGEEIDKAEYTLVNKHPIEHGGKTLYWYEFKSEGKFPTILMMPVHGEDHMPHFHLRIGDDAESMLAKDDWYPTFVSPTVTLDQISEEIEE